MSTPHLEIDPRLPIVPARLEGGISFFRDMENVTFKEDRDSWLSEERRRRRRRGVSAGPGFTSTYSNQRRLASFPVAVRREFRLTEQEKVVGRAMGKK